MLALGALWHSPTVDESAYLSAGVSHWQLGRFDLTKVSPPIIRLVGAAPVCLASPEVNWSSYRIGAGVRSEHMVGRDFVAANGRRSFWLFAVARCACIPFSLLGACVCYRWSLQVWGHRSAFAAALLWCFCPNMLGHGQLMTPDVGVTALSVTAAYLFWHWTLELSWPRATIAGAALGFAILAKTNAVVLVIVLPLIGLIAVFRRLDIQSKAKLAVGQLSLAVLVATYVVNLGYGFEGSFERLDRYEFVSRVFGGATEDATIGNRFKGSPVGWIPVPLPKPFLEGIDLQRRDFENEGGRAKTFFRGEWYDHGWWWYYFYVVAVKVPLGAWALLFTAIVVHALRDGLQGFVQPDLLFLVVPGAALFALACSQTGFGHSLRYVLPAFPFAFVFASGVLRDGVKNRVIVVVAWIGLACHVLSSLSVYPHSLSYFNSLVGGPTNGHAHLLDGNLDWGQDLLYLEKWIKAHPEARPLHVGYWGFLPLDALEMNYSEFDFEMDGSVEKTGLPKVPPGYYAISVNNLRGDFRVENRKYHSFLQRKPYDMVGYSIYIYHVLPDGG